MKNRLKFLVHINRIAWIALAAIALLLTGCSSPKKYTVPEIRAEYEDISGVTDKQLPATKNRRSQPPDETETGFSFPLTLSQVIKTTISNNPNLQQAVYRIAQAKAMKNLADSAFWPVVGFYTEYMQGDTPSSFWYKKMDGRNVRPEDFDAPDDFNDPGWFENYETGIQARMNLFNGGKDYLERQMAKQGIDISTLDRQSVVNDLTAQVIAAFYEVLAAREFVDIAEASVATVSEQLSIVRVQYKGGGALKSDVLSLEVRLAQAKEDLVKSRNRFKLAKAALANLMGVDPAEFSERADLLAKAGEATIQVPETYEDGIVHALSKRPELKKVRKQLIKSRIGMDAAKTGYLPRVDLMGKYYVDDPAMDYDWNQDNWTAALTFNWDLFMGFSRKARVDKAEAMVKELLAADRKAVLDVKLDVKNAYLNLEAAQAKYEVAASSVDSAEESYRLVKEHYQGGSATITRYLKVELDRNRARIRSTAAFYDKIKASADLARAIGKWAGRNPQALER